MAFYISEPLRAKLYQRGIFLVTKVDYETMNALTSFIVNNRPKQKKFTILINSPGGDPVQILSFASFVRTLSKDVELLGVAFNECGSSALALLQCCHHRIAVDYCSFFIHRMQQKPSINCHKPDMDQLAHDIEETRRLEEVLIRLQCERSGMSVENWCKLADSREAGVDNHIFASDALRLGLVDEVVDSFPVF